MGSIRRRLCRLEGANTPPCPGCDWTGDLSEVEYEVVWEDAPSHEPTEPKRCEECGRQLEYVVTWGDIDNTEEDGAWRRA